MKTCKKLLLLALCACLLLTMAGCSSGSEETADNVSLHVVAAAPYVLDEGAQALAAELEKALPQLHNETQQLSVRGVSSGDTETDPMAGMAGMALMGGLMASGEAELMILDADNARRYGDNGESFVPFDQLFAPMEAEELGITSLSVPVLDDMGEPTGEMSAPCGVDLSGCTRLLQMLGMREAGAYVIDGDHVDNAREVILQLLTMK